MDRVLRWKTHDREKAPESLDEYLARAREDELEARKRAATPWQASSEAACVLLAGAFVVLVGSYGQNAPPEDALRLQLGSGIVCIAASFTILIRGVKTGIVMLVPAVPFTIVNTRHLAAALQKCLAEHRWTASIMGAVYGPIVIAAEGLLLSGLGLLVAIAIIRGRGIRWKR
jgi:hypothetical protein